MERILMERKVMGMLVEERDGRFYAVHPATGEDSEGKAPEREAECEVPENMVDILRLRYVDDYTLETDSITYSADFYPDLFKELETGKTAAAAYEALGFKISVLGRFRAVNAARKAKEKASLAKALEELPQGTDDTPPELEQYRSHHYVRLVSGNKLYYTEEFYSELSQRLTAGLSPLEAYKDLGFDPGILGTQRAYKAAEHAREWQARQKEGPVYKVGDFSGAVPLMKMISEAGYPESSSEWVARLMGRVIYLETILEELKKKEIEIFGTVYTAEAKLKELDMPQVAYRFINDLRDLAGSYHLNTAGCLRIFEVKQSTYSGLCKRLEELADEESKRAKKLEAQRQEDLRIKQMILQIVRSRNGIVPGDRSLQLELLIMFQKYVPRRTIKRLKQQMRLMTTTEKNPYRGKDTYLHPLVSPGNYVAGCFYLGYRRVILVDITYCKYDGGDKVCYHIEFYDPFMDKVLGKGTSDTMDAAFVRKAYEDMMRVHGREFRNLVVYLHSDNGSQLLETSISELIALAGMIRSVSRPGTPLDNQPMEAKFSRLKGALEQHLLLCKTVDQVDAMIDGFIKQHEENDACLSLGGLTPNQFEEYILTGVYPLDSYFGIPASELHPVRKLIEKCKAKAAERTARAKKEQREHADRMNLLRAIMELDPHAELQRDRASIIHEKTLCLKNKQSIDTDLKLWEVLEEKVATAISFIRGASPEVLEKLKDRKNWKDYPELNYIYDFPEHKDGKMIVNHKKLGKGISGPLSLWVAVEDFFNGVVRFFEKASAQTRKLLEDRSNWELFPELSFLNVLQDELYEGGLGI